MSEPIPLRMTAAVAERVVRRRVSDSANVIITHHAAERMDERGVTLSDVLTILEKGHVYVAPRLNEHRDWQAEVERRMPGGREVAVVTVIPQAERLIVKTVMWRDER